MVVVVFRSKIYLLQIALSVLLLLVVLLIRDSSQESDIRYDPCCSYPCKNGGICLRSGTDGYTCDCTGLDFTGENCENASYMKRLKQLLRPDPETVQYILTHYPWVWAVINRITPLRQRVMKYIYLSRGGQVDSPPRFTSEHDYVTLEAYFNNSYYARTLPPVLPHCPTPMGIIGKPELPDLDELVEKLFRRRKFIPDPFRSNVLFVGYAQHFTHQFFKTDMQRGPGFTWGANGVDATHIYGKDVETQNRLRSFVDGKLKTQMIDGEEFPPYLSDVPVESDYPPHIPEKLKFAFGHRFYGFLPGLFIFSTIWVREHNRVCSVLRHEHPFWDDERLFQTARLIIVGETIKITVEEYVQHLSQYKFRLTFEPELTFGTTFQYSNRIRLEFNHLYHWHPLVPDNFNVSGQLYPLQDVFFNVSSVFDKGFSNYVDSMVRQRAGKLSHHNHASSLLHIMRGAIEHGRRLRLQSFNSYRIRFGLKPYKTFQELTGEEEMASELERLYGNIDSVEFTVGMFVEEHGYGVTPKTMVEIGGPYSVKGLMANPICSPPYWKPSTFGGDVGFEIVNTASLEKLFCANMKAPCPRISFTTEVDDGLFEQDNDVKVEL